jgi:hypothetical protein
MLDLIRLETLRISTAVDDARALERGVELARRVGRDRQEHVKQLRQQTAPAIAQEAVVGDDRGLVQGASSQPSNARRQAAHMMRVDDLGARGDQRSRQPCGYWVCWVAVEPGTGAKRADPQSTRFDLGMRSPTEGDQLTLDVPGKGARQLERVPFAAAE